MDVTVPKLFISGSGVSKYGTKKDAMKWLKKWGVEAVKSVKKPNGKPWLVAAFETEDALAVAQAQLLRADVGEGKKLNVARKNDTAAEPREKKARTDEAAPGDEAAVSHDVRDIVTPLWKLPYDEQLRVKQKELQECFDKAVRLVRKENQRAIQLLQNEVRQQQDGQHPPPVAHVASPPWPLRQLEPLVPAVDNAVRNKVGLTIGRDGAGAPCVGFRVGRTKNGSTEVAAPEGVSNMSVAARTAWSALTSLVVGHALPPHDNVEHVGFWRAAEVRSNEAGQWVILVQVDDCYAGADEQQMQRVREQLVSVVGGAQGCIGVGLQINRGFNNAEVDWSVVTWLLGDGMLYEQLGNLRFRIPPGAFFQTCTPGAVRLFDAVARLASVEATRLGGDAQRPVELFDVCCGIGTIGLYVRGQLGAVVSSVVGIDIVPQAIEAARFNAEACGYTDGSMTFIAGAAEKVLDDALRDRTKRLVCIVDPPRAGLHPHVLRALRCCPAIQSLIYVSCNPKSLVNDLLPLCKNATKRFAHAPFVPVSMQGFDMFSGADHVEAVVVLRRDESTASSMQ